MHAEEGDENDYGRPLLHKAGGGVSMLECATSCCEKPMSCCTRWPPRVQQSYYRHPQRWHCGLCSLASLVVLLIVIFAGGHAIANKALKSASMKMEHMKVYRIGTWDECKGYKKVSCKWLDDMKGDFVRSRLVRC